MARQEECAHFLKAFGKKLHCLHLTGASKSIKIDELASLAPKLEEIDAEFYFSDEQILQLIKSYPNIRRIGYCPSDIKVETLQAVIRECTNLEKGCEGITSMISKLYRPENETAIFPWETLCKNVTHFHLNDEYDPLQRKMVMESKNFHILTQCNNLTKLTMRLSAIDTQLPLFKLLTRFPNLTKITMFCHSFNNNSQSEKSGDDNAVALEFPNIQKIKGNVPLIEKHFHATFPNANIKLYLNPEGEEYLTTFLASHQKIVAITYYWEPYPLNNEIPFDWFKSENFRKVVGIAGSTLKSIDLGITQDVTEEDLKGVIRQCPNLKSFTCSVPEGAENNPILKKLKYPLAELFKAVSLKSLRMEGVPCDDKAIQKLMKKSRSSLTELRIIYCPITDATIRKIAKFGRGLTTLELTQCKKVTADALTELVKRTPNLKSCTLGADTGFLKKHVALISQRLPNIESIRLTIDISKGNFIKEANEYFPKYIQPEFVDMDSGVVITEKSTPSPHSIFWRIIDQAQQEVVNNIQNIVNQALENHEIAITSQGNQEEVFSKAEFEQFAATHIAEDKLNDIDELFPRLRNVFNLLYRQSVLILTSGPMLSFFKSMITFTSEKTLASFFLTQSLSIGVRLAGQLEETFSESILDKLLNPDQGPFFT